MSEENTRNLGGNDVKPEDLEFVCSLIQRRSGMVLDTKKSWFLISRLQPLLRDASFGDFEALVNALRDNPEGELLQRVIESVAVHESSFFRDHQPFKALTDSVLPRILSSHADSRSLNIWCAGCSTGQEAYSVLLAIRENFPELRAWDIRILATDISHQAIRRAKDGLYSQLEVNRGLRAPLLLRYFEKRDLNWQVRADLRTAIDFRQLNLLDCWPRLPKMNIVFLRNVLIYFDVATKRRLLAAVAEQMREDGFLFLGAAEMPLSGDNAFQRLDFTRSACYVLGN